MTDKKIWFFLALVLVLLLPFSQAGADKLVNFTLRDLSDREISATNFRGKWLILNFWATWCSPCMQEIPELVLFQKKNREKIQIVGIAFEETSVNTIRQYAKKMNINYPILIVGSQPLIPMEPLKGLPSTFLISDKGELVDRHLGLISLEKLDKWINMTIIQNSN